MASIIEFDKFCYKCKHKNVSAERPPCCNCLNVSARENSHTPLFFKERKSKKK